MRARPSVQASRIVERCRAMGRNPTDSSPPAPESHFKNVHMQQLAMNVRYAAPPASYDVECGRGRLKAVNCSLPLLHRYAIVGKDFPTSKTGYPDTGRARAHVRIAPSPGAINFCAIACPADMEKFRLAPISGCRGCIGYLSHFSLALPGIAHVIVHPCNPQALARAITGQAGNNRYGRGYV